MSLKNIHTRFLRSLARNALLFSRWIISRLPYPLFKAFTSIFVAIGRPLVNKKKKLAIENLRMAFGAEKSEQEIKVIADKCFNNFGAGMVELIYLIDRPKDIMQNVTFEGKENLDAALNKGQGVILLSAHLGNFILMYLRMALEGYKTNCIMRRMRDADFEKYISDFRSENGIQTIYSLPHRQCVARSLKVLRENQVLFILLDQNYGDDGRVFVDFFGQPAATATGPVVFSDRSGAPILPIFIVKDGENRHKIIIKPPVEFKAAAAVTTETGADLKNKVAQLTQVIERFIRIYPSEWGGWMHRRWKSKLVVASGI